MSEFHIINLFAKWFLQMIFETLIIISRLAKVYVATAADVKRTILRLLEQPVKGMGMNSPELLSLVEQCPKGAETLVTRVIHVLTDKGNKIINNFELECT